MVRELTVDEIAFVSGGDDDETVEEITVTAPRIPSYTQYLNLFASRVSVSTTSGSSVSGTIGASAVVANTSVTTSANGSTTTTYSGYDTNGDGKFDSQSQLYNSYLEFKQDFLNATNPLP